MQLVAVRSAKAMEQEAVFRESLEPISTFHQDQRGSSAIVSSGLLKKTPQKREKGLWESSESDCKRGLAPNLVLSLLTPYRVPMHRREEKSARSNVS